MKRLYYLSDDIDSTQKIADAIHETGVTDWHFAVYCHDTEQLKIKRTHRAGPLLQLDIVHSAERGALSGAIFGISVGGLFWLLQTPGYLVDAAQFAVISSISCLLGMGFGAIAGFSQRNYKIAPFLQAIEEGNQLILIDVHKNQQASVEALMRQQEHATKVGEGSTISNPFRDFDIDAELHNAAKK